MGFDNNKKIISDYFARLEAKISTQIAPIVAETAVEYYKESFSTKSFDGMAWPAAKRPVSRGSLMVRSGALVNSIRPTVVVPEKVIISAGSSKIAYARVHNEGLPVVGTANIKQFTRNQRGRTTTVRPHTRNINFIMPKRQYMGHAAELNRRIMTRIKSIFNTP